MGHSSTLLGLDAAPKHSFSFCQLSSAYEDSSSLEFTGLKELDKASGHRISLLSDRELVVAYDVSQTPFSLYSCVDATFDIRWNDFLLVLILREDAPVLTVIS
jgi:hypothetical protein